MLPAKRKGELKFLLDENIGVVVARLLTEKGFDVHSVAEPPPGISDLEVLRKSVSEKRIVVTLDKAFGKLVFKRSQKHVGVILRLRKESPERIASILIVAVCDYGDKLAGAFSVVSEAGVRDQS